MADLKNKQYFIKDTSVNGIDGDLFNYADISKVLERILESNEPPYNIAVIGKWGLGKSSLINLVKSKLNTDNTYLFQEINAWKYEKESLRRVYLKQLWQGISGEKLKSFQEIQRIFSDLINNKISQEKPLVKSKWYITFWDGLCKLGRNLRKYCIPAIGIVLFTIIAFIVYKLIQAHTENIIVDAFFWWKVVLSYCKNIGITLLLPVLIALLTALHNEYRRKEPKQVELKFPLETADDYELFLENAIADKLKGNFKLKIVTVIDDLDRLSLDKIVEALDSIKAFVDLPNCVFIVPFDDEIIKSALEKRRDKQFGEDCEVIESELILDKLFQFKVYLPPLLKYDISDYTMKLIKREIPDFINDYCPEKILSRLVSRIIIHSDVSTPRQVKKLVNAFVNNYLIAREREESGRVEKGLLTGERGIEQIAKMSVLQADFNHFYDSLFIDFSYITRFVEMVQSQCEKTDVPVELQRYFEYNSNANEATVVGVLSIHEPLLNFLIRTEKYSIESIAPFLYLAQDAISIKTGDEQQRRAIAALESGNEATLKTMIVDKPEIVEAIIAFVSDCTYAELPLKVAYPMLNIVEEQYTKPLANVLVERSIEADVNMDDLSHSLLPIDVVNVAKQTEMEEYSTILVDKYLLSIANEKKPNGDAIINMLTAYIPIYKTLSSDAKGTIKRATKICCSSNKILAKSILQLLDYSDSIMFTMLWGFEWLGKLCAYILSENDYSPDVVAALKESFGTLTKNTEFPSKIKCVFSLFKLPPLLSALNKMFNVEVCSQLDKAQSTEIANELIAYKYDSNAPITQLVHELLSKLSYVVDENNAEEMTAFTANYATSALMDDVLVYIGKNGFFPNIEATLNSLVSDIFDDDSNDGLLGKICGYLAEDAREELFTLLKQKAQYRGSEDYARELAVVSVLAPDDSYKENFENFVATTLLSPTNARQNYYCQNEYFDFLAQVIGAVKKHLQQETIDNYVDKLVSLFPSYRMKCLYAFERLAGRFSKERYVEVFPLVTSGITDSEFEQALNILIDNEKVRPKEEGSDRTIYREFLASHIEKSVNPNRVLQTLNNAFGSFLGIKELTVSALNNSVTDRNLLISLLAKCITNYDVNRIANESLPMFENAREFSVLQEVLNKQIKHSLEDIFAALSEKLDTATDIDTLVNMAVYATKYNSIQAKDLYFKTLNFGLERDNVPEKVVKIVMSLSTLNQSIIDTAKEDFIDSLYLGFTRTTSESILNAIITIVRQHKWTRQFKKLLKDNTEKLDLFDKLAK